MEWNGMDDTSQKQRHRSGVELPHFGLVIYIAFRSIAFRSTFLNITFHCCHHSSRLNLVHYNNTPLRQSMAGGASHLLITSNSEQDNEDRQLLSLTESIKHVVQEYNTTGIPRVPGKIRTNLKDRLILTWGTNSRRTVPSTNWRNDRARNVYLEVQDSNPHLFLAFLSVVSPTVCSTPNFQKIVTKLLSSDKQIPVELKLNTDAKDFFGSIAAEETLTDKPRYIEFVKALFPEGLQRSHFNLSKTNRNVGQDLTCEHGAGHQDRRSRKRPRVSESSSPTVTSKAGASPTGTKLLCNQ